MDTTKKINTSQTLSPTTKGLSWQYIRMLQINMGWNQVFLIFILAITLGTLEVYRIFQNHFSPTKWMVREIGDLRQEQHRGLLREAILKRQMEWYQVTLSESKIPGTEDIGNSLRAPAQITTVGGSTSLVGEMESSLAFAEGREAFFAKNYKKASEKFKSLVEEFPVSTHTLKGHFFLGESYFLGGQWDEALDEIYLMMEQFPDSEMTGYILLRMGQILDFRKNPSEAAEVYRLLIENFSHYPQLKKQAQVLLAEVDSEIQGQKKKN